MQTEQDRSKKAHPSLSMHVPFVVIAKETKPPTTPLPPTPKPTEFTKQFSSQTIDTFVKPYMLQGAM
jgi:hypothetical protein